MIFCSKALLCPFWATNWFLSEILFVLLVRFLGTPCSIQLADLSSLFGLVGCFPLSKKSFSRCGRPVSATLVTEASQGWGRLGRLLPPTRYVQLVFGLIFVPLYLSMFLFVFLWNIWKFQYVEARSLGQSMWFLKLVVLRLFYLLFPKKQNTV